MSLRYHLLSLGLIASLLLALAGCRRTTAPPAGLEAAIVSQDWQQIETLAQDWLAHGGNRAAAILLGYAALERGEAQAAQHFLRAQTGRVRDGELLWLEELAVRHPDCATAQLLAADALARRGDNQTALTRLDAALTLKSDWTVPRLARGLLRTRLQDPTAALQDLEALTHEGSPVRAEALVARGLARLPGAPEQAEADFTAALAFAPDNATAYNALGVAEAQRGDWESAAEHFAHAFRVAPALSAARQNWQLAQDSLSGRGANVTAHFQLGVYGTGINTEGDINYAITHAQALNRGREQAYLYVGIRGNAPLAGVDKMRRQGVATVVVEPDNVRAGNEQIGQFISRSIAAGKNPIVFIDINKSWPTQLGNNKPEATALPAGLAVEARRSFQSEVRQRGVRGTSTIAGHSDFTWVVQLATALATRAGVPFTYAFNESARSERGLQEAVRLSPATRFTTIQTRNDLWTLEAQWRFVQGEPEAHAKTIKTYQSMKDSNHTFVFIENPTSGGLTRLVQAHGEAADYNRYSQLSVWQGGNQVSAGSGPLGQQLRMLQTPGTATRTVAPPVRGGISVGPTNITQAATDGQVVISGPASNEGLRLVYPLFGGN